MPTFSLHTLGCRANQADSERLAEILRSAGFSEVPFGDLADCQIVNTCTVTREADRKSAQMVRRALRNGETVVATGCGMALKGGVHQRLPGSVLRLEPERQESILELLGAQQCPSAVALERPLFKRDRVRSLLRIQDGCNQFCTFCIVPYVRGRSRSRSSEWVVEQVLQLEREGEAEVVLSGVHLSSWGQDLQPGQDLADLLRAILAATQSIRVRLSSVEPDLFPVALFELMAANPERVCPHLHLVLQHASDRVLSRMHRDYDLAHYQQLVGQFLASVPGASLTTDVMVGFPGESEEDFRQLLQYVRQTAFSKIHVFPYSARPGTAAARFSDSISAQVLEKRRGALLRLAARKAVEFQQKSLGQIREAVIEAPADPKGWMKATSDNFLPLWVRGGEALRGRRLRVEFLRRWKQGIVARVLESGEGQVS